MPPPILTAVALTVFLLASAALVYTLVGYPIFAATLARLIRHLHPPPPAKRGDDPPPTLSVVICAKNEADRIASRVRNLCDSDYPHPPQIVVVCDGCSDHTARIAREAGATTVIEREIESGKAACLTAGVGASTGELIVFTDSRQRFQPDALRVLARAFDDPKVGAAGGALEIETAGQRTVGKALQHYWTTEKALRLAESRIDSTVGCTGAIYAIRRNLYQPIPADTILDDVLIPMQIALQGYRVIFQPDAIAFDPQSLGGKTENSRKKRTLAGNFQLLFRYPSWLLPWRNRLALQLVSHKYARLGTPVFVILILLSNAALISTSLWATICFATTLFLLSVGTAGLLSPRLSKLSPIVYLASSFMFVQIAICRSFFYYLNWRSMRRTAWR